jgi:hypothetical protein
VRQTEQMGINIPVGINDGQVITIQGRGNAGMNGGPAGDLQVQVSVRPHPLFERDGFDMWYELPITYAQAALERAGVTVIMNLADTRQEAESYPGFRESYYARQKVVFLSLGIDVTEESFRAGLARGLAFFAENEGVYAVHCTEGKDRAGFVSALLECFSGASYEEVVADYMTTYENYYGVEKDSEKYTAIAGSNIIKTLETAFAVEDLEMADLQAEAEEYMRQIGLTDAQIGKLKENLGIPRKHDWIWPLIAVGALLILGAAVITVKRRRN